MRSPLLALFIRSLREDSRSRATYWARAGLGGFLLLVMSILLSGRNWGNAPGRTFFTAVISFQVVGIALMGLSYFASAVAEEKEEQTLGLLRMTDLSPLSILLGKSTSRLCGALLLLAAQFPFTIMAVTFGGISVRQIVAAYFAVGAFTFLFCNLALLGSVISRGVGGAAAFCIASTGLILAMVPLLKSLQSLATGYFHWNAHFDSVASGIWDATIIARLFEVLGTGYGGGLFGWQFWTNIAFGIACFLLAWAAFQRFCDRESVVTTASVPLPVPVLASASALAQGTGPAVVARQRRSRVPRTWQNALVWKDFYFLFGGRLGVFIRSAAYGCAVVYDVWELATDGRSALGFGVTAVTLRLMPFIFSIDIGIMASRMFRTELRDQTLSALATIPGTMRDIVRQKILACLLAAAPGIIGCVTLQVIAFSFKGDRLMAGLSMSGLMMATVISGWCFDLLLVVLIAWLSLYMKRGALPAGFLLSYIGTTLTTAMIWAFISSVALAFSGGRLSFIQWSPLVTGLLGLLVAWALYFGGLQRLQALAGEE